MVIVLGTIVLFSYHLKAFLRYLLHLKKKRKKDKEIMRLQPGGCSELLQPIGLQVNKGERIRFA